MQTFSKVEALSFGWHRFKERPFFLIGLFIITTVISAISGYVADEIGNGGAGVVINLLDFAIQIIIGIGITLILLRVYDKVETDYADLLEQVHLFWKYLVMTILVLVVVVFGFVLFIVPGIIAGLALSFAPYLIVDRNLGPIEAMKQSVEMTHGHRWNLFIFALTIFFFNLLGALFFGVGLLITIPVSALATVHIYRWLLNPTSTQGIEVSNFAKMASAFLLLTVIAIVVLFLLVVDKSLIGNNPEARDLQRKSDLVEIKLGAALYFDVNGFFPASIGELVPEYMDAIPTDPNTGYEYDYVVYAEGVDYELCTTLETEGEFEGTYCEFGLDLGVGGDNLDFDNELEFYFEDVVE